MTEKHQEPADLPDESETPRETWATPMFNRVSARAAELSAVNFGGDIVWS